MDKAKETSHRALRVLVVEDSEIDYNFLVATLARAHALGDACRVETREQMQAALAEGGWDIVVSDHNLPNFSSFGALDTLRESGLDLPFVIVSGQIGEESAVEAMRAGADDYLLKDRLARLVPAIEAAMARAAARREARDSARALAESERKLSSMTAHMAHLAERERAAMARDLHDEVGGSLAALNFQLAALRPRVAADPESAIIVEHMASQVDSAIGSLQRMMSQLHPTILDDGLVPALEWQAREFSRRTGIATSFRSNHEDISLPPAVANAAYHVCQEALTNVMKHSRATSAHVELFIDADNLTLEIGDNGQGVQPDQPSSHHAHFGIVGMRERARHLGGWFELSTSPGGTCVMLSLPLGEPGAGDAAADMAGEP
ncbi:hybrid sensor histidine kinase/response regulator [Derxia gummosa]|uniref:Hybrid sensor histidine kinase/response regulator n=1 Tax=Derxia gummosa DSM 723 TaxID=1121388 RepID=A0A8B6X7E6_9BURK|nr:response regulator [Derxia gummosa]